MGHWTLIAIALLAFGWGNFEESRARKRLDDDDLVGAVKYSLWSMVWNLVGGATVVELLHQAGVL